MKYTFKTIVAPEIVREKFSKLRDKMNTSDKELMQAFWNIATTNKDALEAEVLKLKEQAATAKAIAKAKKVTAKEKELAKVAKKKAAKKSAPKKIKEKVEVIAAPDSGEGNNSEEMGCLIVDGTQS